MLPCSCHPCPHSPSSLSSISDQCVPGKIPVLSCRVQVCCLHGFPPTLDPLDYIQRHVAIPLEVTACTGLLHSRTFPKLTGEAVVLSRTRLSLFAILCPKHSFAFLSTSVIIRKVAVKYGCLGTSGAHHWEFVLDILESLYFYNFFLHRMSDVSFSCLMFGFILWLFL